MTSPAMGERERTFILTEEHRRFVEFAKAVHQHRYIGLCFGPAGVGKTLSARRCAHWDEAEPIIEQGGVREDEYASVQEMLARSRTVVHTPSVLGTLRDLRDTMATSLAIISGCIEEQLHRAGVEIKRQNTYRLVEMVIIDEAERLPTTALELVRDIFDRTGIGVILIGIPGMEKRMSRYPQLHSCVGFAHHYRPLHSGCCTACLCKSGASSRSTVCR